MDWNICVVSDCDDGNTASLNNALLYGSSVVWLPGMLARCQDFDYFDSLCRQAIHERGDMRLTTTVGRRLIDPYRQSLDCGFSINTPFTQLVDVGLVCRSSAQRILLSEPDMSEQDRVELIQDHYARYQEKLTTKLSKFLGNAHSSIISAPNLLSVTSPQGWQAHKAAQELMNAMQRVLLPNVSDLALDQVRDLQDRARDELEPMRAEMLRLTEDLRKMLDSNWDTADLAREAKNLITTRVEPSVRELNSRIKSDVEQAIWSTVMNVTKAICVIGFGRLAQKSEYIDKGLIDFANATAEKLPNMPTLKADTAASRFVIEIQHGLKKLA